MAKVNSQGRSKNTDSFVALPRYLIKSVAYIALTPTAKALYTQFLYKFTGNNNGEIFMSVRMAAKLIPCSNNTAHKALLDLVDKGFIKAKQKGSFSYKQRHATEWIITLHNYSGNKATKEFMKWQPKEKNTVLKNDKSVLKFNTNLTKPDIKSS
ncbi:MAG: hypothetical protein JKY45_10085 [Emcibacter sp.]|nr:hypothetical protein [Emcibacter sp.]